MAAFGGVVVVAGEVAFGVGAGNALLGGGFELGNREEVFVEVRQLAHLYIKGSAGTNGTCTFIAS